MMTAALHAREQMHQTVNPDTNDLLNFAIEQNKMGDALVAAQSHARAGADRVGPWCAHYRSSQMLLDRLGGAFQMQVEHMKKDNLSKLSACPNE